MNILALNPGSSSLKFALFDSQRMEADSALMKGDLTRLGHPDAKLVLSVEGEKRKEAPGQIDLSEAVRRAVSVAGEIAPIEAVGCRVVHGGPGFAGPAKVDADTLAAIRELEPLAPLHNQADVQTIESVSQMLPSVPVVAVFDTSFHRTLPPEAATYAIPQDLADRFRIRRYGFHGISYRYVWDCLASSLAETEGRLIACHLGSGASVCAIRAGKSVDTSMGLTPLEGLIMGTRSGDLDPGAVLFLQREAGLSFAEVDDLLNHRSGLLGLSGVAADTRDLEEAASAGNADAERALAAFAYRVSKYIGAYAAALGGVDALAFTGGIGEHSPNMRRRICDRLGFLGIRLSQNPPSESRRIEDDGGVPTWVIPAAEELQVAREVHRLIA